MIDLDKELQEQEQLEEQKAAPTTEADKLAVEQEHRINRWLAKRAVRLTSSNNSKLNSKGKGKDVNWGEQAKNVLYELRYGIRTGLVPEQKDFWQMRHGKENEPVAVEYLRANKHLIEELLGSEVVTIEHCSEDYEDIEFLTPFEGFGDSPDIKIVLADGRIWRGEIKCPVNAAKVEALREEKQYHDKLEYFDQMIGHLIGDPEAEGCLFVNYDAFANEVQLLPLYRKDVQQKIEAQIERIKQAYHYVSNPNNKISEINNYNFEACMK